MIQELIRWRDECNEETVVTSYRLTKNDKRRLDDLCGTLGMSASEVMRYLLKRMWEAIELEEEEEQAHT